MTTISRISPEIHILREGGRWPPALTHRIIYGVRLAWQYSFDSHRLNAIAPWMQATTPIHGNANAQSKITAQKQELFPDDRLLWKPQIAIHLISDSTIKKLNHTTRGKHTITDVLSYPAGAMALPMVGDIFIAYERSRRDASRSYLNWVHYVVRLCIHGTLHLAHWDHHTARHAHAMENLERKIGLALGFYRRLP